MKQFVVN